MFEAMEQLVKIVRLFKSLFFFYIQQEDLVALGKVVLALACNSVVGIQQEHLRTSMELVTRNYSTDLKNLLLSVMTF